jgi:hypothetical protein
MHHDEVRAQVTRLFIFLYLLLISLLSSLSFVLITYHFYLQDNATK